MLILSMRLPLLFVALLTACAARHTERGEASWYGNELRGRPTASGEPFRPSKRTCAHKTLPLGTVLKVKSLDTGKTVRVTVNDRGPYAKGRILDLSRKAAKRIGIHDQGHGPVEIKVVGCKERYGGCR